MGRLLRAARDGRARAEGRHRPQLLDPPVDLPGAELLQALGAEALDVERCERRRVRHRAPQELVVERSVGVSRDVADEPAGERVAGARRVHDLLQRVRGERKEGVARDERRAVLALLGDDDPRPAAVRSAPAEDLACRRDDVRATGELAELAVVEDHAVDFAHDLDEGLARRLDPQVHGVHGDEAGVGHLPAHPQLQLGLDVGEEKDIALARVLRELRREVLEDAEPRLQRLARVHVPSVDRAPEERLAREALHVADVDAARREHLKVLRVEVIADRPDDAHVVKQARREREVDGGAAEHPLALAERRARTASKAIDPTTVIGIGGHPRASFTIRSRASLSDSLGPMRAIQISEFGGPEVLELVDLPVPEPANDEVLIEVTRAGLNFADLHARTNTYVERQTLPLVPGREVAGTLAEGGGRVVALTPSGGYAQYATAHREQRLRRPRRRRRRAALALLIQGTTAWHLYRTAARIADGESVVVHSAAGGVGSLAVQLGAHMGAGRVIATASSEEKRQLARSLGAHAAVDGAPEGLTERLIEANEGKAVDIVFDMAGGASFDASYEALAPFGRIVVCGISTSEVNTVRSSSLLRHSRAAIGFYLFHTLERPGMFAEALDDLFALTQAGTIDPVVGETYPLAEAARAHDDLRARRTSGKLLLDPVA